MIERKHYLHAPILHCFNGWTSAILISLAGHGIFIWAIMMFAGDISKPIPPQFFNVEVVIETPSKKQTLAKRTEVKTIKTAPNQIRVGSGNIPIPQQPLVKEVKKVVPPLPNTAQKELAVRHIYAPVPKHKPDLLPLTLGKNVVSQRVSRPSTNKTIKKNQIEFSLPLRKTVLRDTTPITPRSFGAKLVSETVTAKATVPTLPPQIDPRGENLWPSYPRRARQRGIEGQLLLRITVNSKGRTSGIKVLESSGHAVLDNAAVKAVKHWHFRPGRRGKKPVKASMDMPVVFRLQ